LIETETLQEAQLLQENGALAPRPAFRHGPGIKVDSERSFVPGNELGEIRASE